MTQLRPNVTNPTIASIYSEITSGTLILQPVFQRKFVWTREHQESFIDTILQGLPFPEIYVCEAEIDIENLRTSKAVIDGQQRLTTIKNFIDGIPPFDSSPGLTYKDLSEEAKKQFLSYAIVIRDLGKIEDSLTKEIFRRINLTKFKLDDIEIHNAVYDGHFIQAAKEILSHIDLNEFNVFRESEFTRMADLHFILLVMATLENEGYFAQDKELERLIASLNDNYPNKAKITEALTGTFAAIRELALESDSMWFRKSNFFTLVIELTKYGPKLPSNFKERLLQFENEVMTKRGSTQTPFSTYYSYMYQGTHSRQARVVRGELFYKYCLDETYPLTANT